MVYSAFMADQPERKVLSLVIAHGDIRTPPLSSSMRKRIGFLLRSIQEGNTIAFPTSRPMPSIGPRCHELRMTDNKVEWRVVYHVAAVAVVVLDVFRKTTQKTPPRVIDDCKDRLAAYNRVMKAVAESNKPKGKG